MSQNCTLCIWSLTKQASVNEFNLIIVSFPCFISRLHSYSCCIVQLALAQLDILLPLPSFLCNFWLTVWVFSSSSLLLASFFPVCSTGYLLLLFYFWAIPLEYILDGFWSLHFLFAGRWLSLQSLATVRQILSRHKCAELHCLHWNHSALH